VTPTVQLCECGCGNPAPLAKQNRPDRGQRKGEPLRFINGHNSHRHDAETKAKIAAAGRGRRHSEATKAKIRVAKLGKRHTAESRAKMSASHKLSPPRFGDKAPGWKNGRTIVRGRALIHVGREHPMANSMGYVYEHRLIAAAAIGRMLSHDEHVHHIDLDPLNNAPENLVIVTATQHGRIHRFMDYRGMTGPEAVAAVLGEPA
jgi:hypothetical protein